MNPGDNGIYIIEGWRIADRVFPYEHFAEQQEYDFDEMLHAFDDSMPARERLGAYLDAQEIPVEELRIGDRIWMQGVDDAFEAFPVAGFGDGMVNGTDRTGVAYVERYGRDGNYRSNPNNYPHGKTCRIVPRK